MQKALCSKKENRPKQRNSGMWGNGLGSLGAWKWTCPVLCGFLQLFGGAGGIGFDLDRDLWNIVLIDMLGQ